MMRHNWDLCGRLLIPFDQFTPEELAAYAEGDEDQGHGPSYSLGVEDFAWEFKPAFPLSLLLGGKEGNDRVAWLEWLEDEVVHYRYGEEDGRKYYGELEDWWVGSASSGASCDEPIIAAEDVDGNVYIWGGYHRTAVSHKRGLEAVPVVLGRLRSLVGADSEG